MSESNGVLHFNIINDTSIDRWGHFLTGRDRKLQEIWMSITIEEAIGSGGSLGLFVGSSTWYQVEVTATDGIVLNSGEHPYKTLQNAKCCPSTHLLGIRADGTQIHFYVDGNIVSSFSEIEGLWDPGVIISGGKNSRISGYVDDVWIKFAE